MMTAYDPLIGPDLNEWQALGELEQIALVLAYHREAGVELPNERLHASIHVVVEHQAALGAETPVPATLERLMREGLDRHDAIHAIGSVLAGHIHDLLRGDARQADPNEPYYRQLKTLTARDWREQFE